jgi:phosphate acetyltransferase
VGEIARELHFECLHGTRQSMNHEVSHYKVAAMQVHDFLCHFESCSLVITPGDRSDVILGCLAAAASSNYPMIAGIILTGGQRPAPEVSKLLEGMKSQRLPILSSPRIQSVRAFVTLDDDVNQWLDTKKAELSGSQNAGG